MKRTLFAVSILSAILSAHAQTRTPVRTESAASEFVYEVLGATPSIQIGKSAAKATQTAHAPAAVQASRADVAIPRANETHSASEQARR